MFFHGAISLVFLAILVLVVVKPFRVHGQRTQLGANAEAMTNSLLEVQN
jgi:hypothetical protein